VQPSDPSRDHHDFSWLFRWRSRTATDAEVKGFIEVDHEGKLRSFRRLDPAGRDPRLTREPETFRARAADLARTLVGFDTTPAILKSETRFDADGNPYLHFGWTSAQPDEVGYRSATVDLSANGVRALGTSYADYVDVPIPTQYWSDTLGAFLFFVLLLFVFLTRTVNVGASRLRRPLAVAAVVGAWGGTALPLMDGWLPQGDWPAHILLGLAYFALVFFVAAAGEDTLLSLWPQKVTTWSRPLAGRWLGPRAAVSVLRGTLWGLAFLAVYVPLTTLAAGQGIRLRHWLFEWSQGSAWSPAASFLIGEFAITLLIITGPIAVSMALLKRWLRTPWALVTASAFFTTFVYRQEVLFGEVFGAYVALGFVGFAWFAWCFHDTDLLATIVAMFVFNGVVGTWALMRLNLDVSLTAFLLAFAALAALPGFALVSLRQAAATPDAAGPVAHT
jgi:hypothetical protein